MIWAVRIERLEWGAESWWRDGMRGSFASLKDDGEKLARAKAKEEADSLRE